MSLINLSVARRVSAGSAAARTVVAVFLLLSAVLPVIGQQSDGQPEAQAAGESAGSTIPAEVDAAVRDLGNGDYELNGIRFNSRSREIVLQGVVNLDDELLEYALVHEKGAIHEALIRTTARPFDLQVALLLLRYRPFQEGLFEGFDRAAENGPAGAGGDVDEVPQEARLAVTVRWSENGKDHEMPLSRWILDTTSGESMRSGFWQFSGLPRPGSIRHWKIEHESNLVGIYLDPFSPINFPYEGNRSDEVWMPNREVMPPIETAVEIVLGACDELAGIEGGVAGQATSDASEPARATDE